MKLKQKTSDFRVRELLDFKERKKGEFYIHRLRKEKMETLEAIDRIVRVAEVPRESIAYAGLKDRQGITEQFISIRGRRVELHEALLKLSFVGRSEQAINSKMSSGNSFEIVVRDLDASDIVRLRRNQRSLQSHGLPNYFDDQRFGCLVENQGFIVRQLMLGNPEQALRQLLAAEPRHGRTSGDAGLRRLLHRHWRDWEACRQIARGPMYDRLFGHLCRNPRAYREAFEFVPTRLKLIHLFAFQSALWNLAVSRYLRFRVRSRERVYLPSLNGALTCWRYLDDEVRPVLEDKTLELADARTQFEDDDFRKSTFHVLREMELKMHDLEIRGMKGFLLKEEPRPVMLRPVNFRKEGPLPDEVNKGQFKVKLSFDLPRGSYATLVVRRLLAKPVRTQRDETMGRPDGGRPDGGERGRKQPFVRAANESEPKEPLPPSIRRKEVAKKPGFRPRRRLSVLRRLRNEKGE